MSEFREKAIEKLGKEEKHVSGTKERAMLKDVRSALIDFCRQDEEFAQAVVQGGTLADCLKSVAQGTGSSISDLEAYQKAVQFYFPGAKVRFQMSIDLTGAAAEEKANEPQKHDADTKPAGILLDFTQFL